MLGVSDEVVQIATPPLTVTGEFKGVPLSMNCNVPPARTVETVAVNVTACPAGEGLSLELTMVEVGSGTGFFPVPDSAMVSTLLVTPLLSSVIDTVPFRLRTVLAVRTD